MDDTENAREVAGRYRAAWLANDLAVGAKAPRRLVAVDEVLAGPDAAVLVVREEITTPEGPVEIRRVLRYRVQGKHFVDCWLYEEHQAVIGRAWS